MRFFLSIQSKNRGKGIVFSLPKTNHYQKITRLELKQSANMTVVDEWGNEIIILNDVVGFSLKFNYQPKIYQVLENKWQSFLISDYKKIAKKTLAFYTQSNRFSHSNHPKINRLAKKIVGQEKNLFSIAKKIYRFVLNYLVYDNPIDGLYSDFEALNKKRVDCGGFSTLFISLLNSLKIPARLVIGYIVKPSKLKKLFSTIPLLPLTFDNLLIHAWAEILLPDHSWLPVDASIEWKRKHQLSKQPGGFGFIPDNRLVVSYGCDFKISFGKKQYYFDIIQKPIIYDLN